LLAFPTLGRFLTHGDDPYNLLVSTCLPLYPMEDLLIGRSRFDDLFGSALTASVQSDNIGVRPTELAVDHLPMYLLKKYCQDLANNRDHTSGEVAKALRPLSVQDLEQAGLWERMDAKLAALGGCGNLP
jgi:hypothetical protein